MRSISQAQCPGRWCVGHTNDSGRKDVAASNEIMGPNFRLRTNL